MNRLFSYTMLIIIILSCSVKSQSINKDTLSIKDGFFGLTYQKGTQRIPSKEFEQLLKLSSDKSIFELYSKGSSQSDIAQVIAFGGGFCFGYGLTTKPVNTSLAVIGGVVGIAAIILDNGGRKQMNEAISKYNTNVNTSLNIRPIILEPEYNVFSFAYSF